jgi:hypothetical protein
MPPPVVIPSFPDQPNRADNDPQPKDPLRPPAIVEQAEKQRDGGKRRENQNDGAEAAD